MFRRTAAYAHRRKQPICQKGSREFFGAASVSAAGKAVPGTDCEVIRAKQVLEELKLE